MNSQHCCWVEFLWVHVPYWAIRCVKAPWLAQPCLSSKVFIKTPQLQSFLLVTVPYLSQLSFFAKRQWFNVCSKHNVNDGWYLTVAIVYPNRILCAGRSEQSGVHFRFELKLLLYAVCIFPPDHLERYFSCCSFSVGSVSAGSSQREVVVPNCNYLAKTLLLRTSLWRGWFC